MLSIRMIKLCRNLICKPLSIIFNNCLNKGKFPHEWRKGNVVPVHKKENTQGLKSDSQFSLLPTCSRIFERLIYDEMFTSFTDKNLISTNQSGFRPITNYLLLPTKYVYRLMRGLKLEGFCQIYVKLSIRYGMKVYFPN